MDPPPSSTTTTQPFPTTTATYTTQPYSDTTLDPQPQPLPPKLRLMCSYNGHIVPRLHDKSLCYVGGDTRMVVIPRTSTLSDLLSRLSKTLLNHIHLGGGFTLKYQLPTEDLDSLISVSTDEDLDNMIDEYDRLSKSTKPSRIRLFLFPVQPETAHSMGPILDGSNRSEDWFLNALNGVQELQRGFSDPAINSLVQDMKPGTGTGEKKGTGTGTGQDVHSVPDSPVIGNTSSFGSTSSPPSFMNLPPIRVHVEQKSGGGIEEQFAQMGVSTGGGGGQEGILGAVSGVNGGGEFGAGRGYSEDDRSDHGGVVGFLKQQQMGTGGGMNKQQQQQQFGGDLASPDSVSSDNSLSGAFARQKPGMYQDPNGQSSTGSNSNSNRPAQSMQMQQVSESGYPYHPQYEQHQQQMLQRHQHQQQQQQQHHQHQQQHLLQQQQQQQQQHGQTQQPTQQQYVQSGGQFLQHHPGSMPVPSYYPVYPSQQQQQQPHHPQQYQVYYMPAGQAQGYSLQGQQQQNMGEGPTSVSSNRTQMTNNPTMMTNASPYNPSRNMNMPPPKSEAGPGLYRTAANAAGGAAQRVQVPSGQHQLPSQSQPQPQPQQQQQFMGYSQMNHPSQSTASNMGASSGYAYDPAHAQVYYTQAPGLASQYQGVTSSGPSMMMSDVSSQVSNESGK